MIRLITTLPRAGTLAGICILLCGCATPAEMQALQAIRADIVALQAELEAASVATQYADVAETNAVVLHLQDDFTAVNQALVSLQDAVEDSCKPLPVVKEVCEPSENATLPPIVLQDDKMVLGEVENVWIDPPGLSMEVRVDTGASSSSLHAENITEFERDGSDWVRFDMINKQERFTVEQPVEKYVRVYQQSDKEGTRRPVVAMRIFLGDIQDSFEFTLADRAHLEHDVILGRNFLTDIALVDVGRQFVQPAYQPQPR